jgi:hypothetical protein
MLAIHDYMALAVFAISLDNCDHRWGFICPPRVAEPEAVLDRSGRGEIVRATAAALIIGVLVSLGAVYGLNRYLGPSVDPAETTGALHHRTPTD